MFLLGLLCGIAQVSRALPTPGDALNYWRAGTSPELYPEHWGQWSAGQYLYYPPPVAQISTFLQPIGWPAFVICWTTLIFVCFWYCAGRWALPLVAVGLPTLAGVPIPYASTFLGYALLGNMQWMLAALAVMAIRHPAAWSVLLLTKTGPAIGALWHMARGEWRAVAMAVASSAVLVALFFWLAPHLWFDWAGFTIRNLDMSNPPQALFPVPFALRLATSAILVAWGARTDRPWTVPIAAGWAVPALYGWGFLPFWVGAVSLAHRAGLPVRLQQRVLSLFGGQSLVSRAPVADVAARNA